MKNLMAYFLTLLSILLIDMVWLGFIAKSVYWQNIGFLLRKSGQQMTPNWLGAAIVYIALTVGIFSFVLPKAHGNYLLSFAWGALLGGIIYAVYDFTNFSVLDKWPLKITLIDTLWGIFLCGTGAFLALFYQKLILKF